MKSELERSQTPTPRTSASTPRLRLLSRKGDGAGCTASTAAALLEQQQDQHLSGLSLYFFGQVSYFVIFFLFVLRIQY